LEIEMTEQEITRSGQLLSDLSNAMVALHREQFGHGPGAARTTIDGNLVTCMLTDVYTQVERTLIDAGEFDHVRKTRSLHQAALEEKYKDQVETITGRRVEAVMCAVHADPDLAIEIFVLA
jgi:uncharacterized protein YbcI